MSRVASVGLFVLALTLSAAGADVPVAPPPREVRPDGSRDPVPPPEAPPKGENPAVTVERIIKNSKDVSAKLEKTDTGADTRKTQGKILSDIDALIDRQENPPPPQPDQNKDKDKQDQKDKQDDKKDQPKDKSDQKDKPDDKKDMGMGMPMKNDMPMSKDGMDPMPKGGMGMGDPPPDRKPRMGEPSGDEKKDKDKGGKPKDHPGKPDDKQAQKEQMAGKGPDPKKGGTVGKVAGNPMGKVGGKPALPFEEEDASKDVWGHLPDKLRQQMSQYYKDEFTPKYAELLKLYYSSLADKNAKPAMPKK